MIKPIEITKDKEIQDLLFDAFCFGVDYGQLLMEEERDSEDEFDAFQGHIIDKKYCMPSHISPRRQPHSEKWRAAKRKSKDNFFNLLKTISDE